MNCRVCAITASVSVRMSSYRTVSTGTPPADHTGGSLLVAIHLGKPTSRTHCSLRNREGQVTNTARHTLKAARARPHRHRNGDDCVPGEE